MTNLSITVHVRALEGAIPFGSHLSVRIVDATAVGETQLELAQTSVDDWDGAACSVELAAPEFVDNRDYLVLAHAGPTAELAVGDWITMDDFSITNQTADITLHQV